MQVKILTSSDCSMCVEFGNVISEEINNHVRSFVLAAEAADVPGIVELVPTYRSVTVHYRPEIIGYGEMFERLTKIAENITDMEIPTPKNFVIPVLYGGEFGPDLANVAATNNLSEKEVIELHSAPEYLIYMLGFMPGFCYLGGIDDRIATPRLKDPRVKIPAGSVGIADKQTGMYPIESPGGWQLIGITPLRLYNPNREKPILLEAGSRLRFRPICLEEYNEIRAKEYPEEYNGGAAK